MHRHAALLRGRRVGWKATFQNAQDRSTSRPLATTEKRTDLKVGHYKRKSRSLPAAGRPHRRSRQPFAPAYRGQARDRVSFRYSQDKRDEKSAESAGALRHDCPSFLRLKGRALAGSGRSTFAAQGKQKAVPTQTNTPTRWRRVARHSSLIFSRACACGGRI